MSQTPDDDNNSRQDELLSWLTQDHRGSVDWNALDDEQRAVEKTAALYAMARLDRIDAMPADVERRLLAASRPAAEPTPSPARSTVPARSLPWWANVKLAWGSASFASAVALVLAYRLASVQTGVPTPQTVIDVASSSRYSLLPGPDALGKAVQGEVVWDAGHSGGMVKLTGLPINDPTREQYQLWIFDGSRDERYPVDGGVFNVVRNGEVEVWIRVPIPVRAAAMFAVTVEKAGGTVVSDRSRIVALAKTGT